MVVFNNTMYRGRKQKIGSPLFSDGGKLHFFIGYCDNCQGKCAISPEDARILMRMFGKNTTGPIKRMTIRFLRKYASDY